jgi:hypothetical protein
MIKETDYYKSIFPTLFEELNGKNNYPPSNLIVDGIVASGKSTFVNCFKSYLEKQDYHAAILRIDWFLTIQENRMPPYFIIMALFLTIVFGMNSRIFKNYLSTFIEIEKINSIISKINSFQENSLRDESLSIQIKNQIRQVDEVLVIKCGTSILIEGVFSRAIFNQLENCQKLLISIKTSIARRLFFERSKGEQFKWLRIFIQSIAQLPPGYMQIISKRSSTYDYILDMNDLSNPQINVMSPKGR